jgi:hypothetical protein
MGVDCNAYLYQSADARDVAAVLAALAGNTIKEDAHGNAGGEAVIVRRAHIDDMLRIEFPSPADPKCPTHACAFFFNADGPRHAFRLVMMRSTAFWIAAARGLVDVFGGFADYSDSDTSEVDYARFEAKVMAATDGDAWRERQDRILSVKAIAPADLMLCEQWAAYKSGDLE